MTPTLPCVTALLLSWITGAPAAQAPAADRSADLRAKSIDTRLEAIDAMASSTRKDADVLLIPLLNDRDWEVQERTAITLGKLRPKTALRPLVDLALDGDVSRVRTAAAQALGLVGAAEAAAALHKRAKGKTLVRALDALALANRRQPPFAEAEKLSKLLRDESTYVRESAAAAWLECTADRAAALRTLLGETFLAVRCRALDAVAEAPRAEDLEPLSEAFAGGTQNDVVERRLVRALAAVIGAAADPAALLRKVVDGAGDAAPALLRRARLCALLARGEQPPLDQKSAVAVLRPSLVAPDAGVRAAASKALREIGGKDALDAALAHWPQETDARVQWQVVETVTALRPPTTPQAVSWLTEIVSGRHHDAVRERAIVLLGRSGVEGAAETLTRALGEERWTLACCAAVSLGETDDDKAFAPLHSLLKHEDWKLRGAAVVGLMHWNRADAVEPLIGMLADPHPVVARSALEALRAMSLRFEVGPDPKAWQAWWATSRASHRFVDRAQSIDKLKKYGYAVPDTEIYQGLDVVVFKSRGDHIEQLLARLQIAHRETEAGKVTECGLHPEAIFVSNCTGEITPPDLEPLVWFVRTGGSLFGSCWSLSQTIERIHPGIVQKAHTRVEVLDDVRALPCRAGSALLNGVFPPGVVPIYHLEGAHLIEVLDERCEVLIDSPDAAERHGTGNLAAWFFSGHGVILDSVNHFDLQGLAAAKDLKTAEDRQAFAVDHMGLSLPKWRETRSEAYWKAADKASRSVPDLSAFRLLTNFVRSKRMAEY